MKELQLEGTRYDEATGWPAFWRVSTSAMNASPASPFVAEYESFFSSGQGSVGGFLSSNCKKREIP